MTLKEGEEEGDGEGERLQNKVQVVKSQTLCQQMKLSQAVLRKAALRLPCSAINGSGDYEQKSLSHHNDGATIHRHRKDQRKEKR